LEKSKVLDTKIERTCVWVLNKVLVGKGVRKGEQKREGGKRVHFITWGWTRKGNSNSQRRW